MATLPSPAQVPLHLNVIGTLKGAWSVQVESVAAAPEDKHLLLHLCLIRISEGEQPPTSRRLYAVVSEPSLEHPQQRVLIADQIRRWLDRTDGNGWLVLD